MQTAEYNLTKLPFFIFYNKLRRELEDDFIVIRFSYISWFILLEVFFLSNRSNKDKYFRLTFFFAIFLLYFVNLNIKC